MYFDEYSKNLIVGDREGKAIQYKRDLKTRSWRKFKDYGVLGIKIVSAISSCKNLIVLGGSNSKFVIINPQQKEIVRKSVDSKIGWIYSLQICETWKKKFYLTLTCCY